MKNTANITSNIGKAAMSHRKSSRRRRKPKRFFDDSPQKLNLVGNSAGTSKKSRLDKTVLKRVKNSGKENAQPNTLCAKTVSVAKDSPFKELAGRVNVGTGHGASGIFTPSNLMCSPNGDSNLFSPGTLALLQASPTTTAAPVRGIAFSLDDEFQENAGYSSDSEKSDLSGITDPMSTSSSDGNFFQLSDSEEDSRDSFSSKDSLNGSPEADVIDEAAIDLNGLGFKF